MNNENDVEGIITDGDVRRLLEKTDDFKNVQAKDILSTNPKTVLPEILAIDALQILKEYDISQLIVINNNGIYLGILHLHDLIREGII